MVTRFFKLSGKQLLLLPVLVLGVALAMPAAAERIYRIVDEEGRVTYSDQPPSDDAEPYELPDMTTFEAPPAPDLPAPAAREDDDEDEQDEPRTHYAELAISAPGEDELVRANNGEVTIQVQVVPSLAGGHRLQLLLNGQAQDLRASGGSFLIENADRGTQTAQVRIVSQDGQALMESEPVTFHVMRPSIHAPARRN